MTTKRIDKELISDLFYASQTGESLRGGTMPEDLPTPEKSIAEIEKEQLAALKRKGSQLMLDE